MVDRVIKPTRPELAQVAQGNVRVLAALEALFDAAGVDAPDELAALDARLTGVESAGVHNVRASQQRISDIERGAITPEFMVINDRYDFPKAESGVIPLSGGVTYFISGEVDLRGDRLQANGDVALIGGGAAISALKSTSLIGAALLTSEHDLHLQNLTLEAQTMFDLTDLSGRVFRWLGVVFKDVANMGTFDGCEVFSLFQSSLDDVAGLVFSGNIGAVDFVGVDGAARPGETLAEFDADLTIERRILIDGARIDAPSGATVFDVDAGAIIPSEGYATRNSVFTGAGTAFAGVAPSDAAAWFTGNVGVEDSAAISSYSMTGNATETVITAANTPVKIAGTSTSQSVTQRFTNTDNRAEYDGATGRNFYVQAQALLTGAASTAYAIYIAKNGAILAESRVKVTTDASGNAPQVTAGAITSLSDGDYIEVWAANLDGTDNVTIADLHLMAGVA